MTKKKHELTGHVVSHTHWDRAWYWTFQQTRVQLLDLMDDLLDLMERDRGYKHFVLDGQLAMVLDYLALRPERTAQLRRLVAAGRLLLGPFFVLPDLFIPTGESLVRNLRAGQAAAADLGPTMKLGYLPDPFGHPDQLPQVLQGFGIDGMLMSRGMGDEAEFLDADFFWEAPDGSRVLASHQVGGGYGNLMELGRRPIGDGETPLNRVHVEPGTPARALSAALKRAEQMGPDCPHGELLLNNGCDHLPAQPELPALLRAVNRRQRTIRLVHSTPVRYQRAVRRAIKQGRFTPQVHRGELRGGLENNLLPGVLSARVDLKLRHHACETLLLRQAEPWAAAAAALGLGRDDRAVLECAWRHLLLCQPHDDICGCSIDAVHDDDHNQMAQAEQIGARVRDRALQALGRQVASPEALAFNPHPWPVEALVRAPASDALVACSLPPTGWAPISAGGSGNSEAQGVTVKRSGKTTTLDNGLVRLRLDQRGTLRLDDLRTGLRLSRAAELVDDGDAGDTYDFSPPRRQSLVRGLEGAPRAFIVERGPLRAAVELRGKLKLPVGLTDDRRARSARRVALPVSLRVSLRRSSPLVTLTLSVDNRADDHRLRLAVPTPVQTNDVLAGAPFSVVRRPATPPERPNWFQPPLPYGPFTDWFAVQDDAGRGVAVLAPGLREMEAQPTACGTRLLLTLLRSVGWLSRDDLSTRRNEAGPCFEVQGARQRGPHTFRVALLPYAGGWSAAQVQRRFAELAAPPFVLPPQTDAPEQQRLPDRLELLSVEPAAVSLAAMIPREHGAVELRLVNYSAAQVTARLGGALIEGRGVAVRRAGLDGAPTRRPGDPRRVRIGPWKIQTLLIEAHGRPRRRVRL
jgi:2-O-(6-phospho-alpha-D-mannosyl)-D-glycerate hydrolase